jgi:hypothetical protein
MADDELDELYMVNSNGFVALRGKLLAAAKQRGDPAAVKRISAARKPTTAAWVVNRLDAAEKAYDWAKRASQDAAASVKDLNARLRHQRRRRSQELPNG